MRILLAILIAASVSIPPAVIAAQPIDTLPSLSVMPTTEYPFFHITDEKTVIIVGEIRNDNEAPVTDILLSATLYAPDDPTATRTVTGYPLLDVIPPGEGSPYVIQVEEAGDSTAQVRVNVIGIAPTVSKPDLLDIRIDRTILSEWIHLEGAVINEDDSAAENTSVHIALYDPFTPPRVVGVHTAALGDIEGSGEAGFRFSVPHGMGYSMVIFADSDEHIADTVELELPRRPLSEGVTVHYTEASNGAGEGTSLPFDGSEILIESLISAYGDALPSEYQYYVQIRDAETASVEFIEGQQVDVRPGFQSPSVTWIPPNPGTYTVEIFVWDRYGAPLVPAGNTVTITLT